MQPCSRSAGLSDTTLPFKDALRTVLDEPDRGLREETGESTMSEPTPWRISLISGAALIGTMSQPPASGRIAHRTTERSQPRHVAEHTLCQIAGSKAPLRPTIAGHLKVARPSACRVVVV